MQVGAEEPRSDRLSQDIVESGHGRDSLLLPFSGRGQEKYPAQREECRPFSLARKRQGGILCASLRIDHGSADRLGRDALNRLSSYCPAIRTMSARFFEQPYLQAYAGTVAGSRTSMSRYRL